MWSTTLLFLSSRVPGYDGSPPSVRPRSTALPPALGLDSAISRRIDGDLPIDSHAQVDRRQGHVPWPWLVGLSLRGQNDVAFQSENGPDLRHQPGDGHITGLATEDQ